ncbi:leucyl-tRNA synthetase [Catalinimonas alkaloidigena]|uniref:Leucine--tRNA ligase n=1 Tax=Catalinimonas alkaloidigena TaxID=1075417 RepID=A0A1G8X9A8_9BACT|nr:leucine--tRNA ligase [Catalinimonas alkaloidigena]SDJ87279.1 leucyl-tRNA synthetase [Catalinimonas alkaloidigena]
MEYDFRAIEQKWQQHWRNEHTYRTEIDPTRPKFYVLDMFPYPSGAGLHVGHPLGYIASDVVARYKRHKGFNVLHPMGFDAFGLPAEQYAIETGQHPAITTENNIRRYKEQLQNIGFSYDWDREVQTSDPSFYRWTQWIFSQLFDSWYNQTTDRAEPIATLIDAFAHNGNLDVQAVSDEDTPRFSAETWQKMSEQEQQTLLLKYRLAYLTEATVNWCPALGTVLANDEVKDGVSERGGYPVERRKMQQWMLRITAYADRLLRNLDTLAWSDAMVDMQRNWIGKSNGAELNFPVVGKDITLTAFTTRADTIFGVTYVVVAPEHELVPDLTTPEQKAAVEAYLDETKSRSELDRMSDVKTVSGVFTGSYVKNPLSDEEIPLWIADYVLAGYGTGVVMAVPASDERDYRFAKHFGLEIRPVIEGTDPEAGANPTKEGVMINSGFLNGMTCREAIDAAIAKAEELGLGKAKVNFRMRDAIFSRQRYWGEPVPIYFKDGLPQLVDDAELPLVLPEIDQYKPTETGEPPLARAEGWQYHGKYDYELTTMPGWAGSSWYFLRYMDPQNDQQFVSEEAVKYWNQVDLYIGGTEHATGHLLYSRFWNLFLYDRGYIFHEEPFQKLINQGMIQGRSNLVYLVKSPEGKSGKPVFVSMGLKDQYDVIEQHVDVNLVENDVLNVEAFRQWRPENAEAEFILEAGQYRCGYAVEKMSKRWFNVVNPDDIVARYGADTLRLYEMFLGPLEQSKPWNTNGIDGAFKFLRKVWRLFYDEEGKLLVTDEAPTPAELKVLHQTLKKVEQDIERDSFNTPVSTMMICVNELTSLNCHKRAILQELLVMLSPYAPHLAEELWAQLSENWPQALPAEHRNSVTRAPWPQWEEKYLREDSFEYPVSINGKMRTRMAFALDMPKAEMEREVLASETVQKWTEGKPPKKVIIVPQRIINIVV